MSADDATDFQLVPLPDEPEKLLFIGPREALSDEEVLKRRGVTHILSVLRGASSFPLDPTKFERLIIEAEDNPSFDLLGQWPRCCEFLDGALEAGGGALVHCSAGAGGSRSGATLVAYLVHRLRRRAGECLALAQRARTCVQPNDGFWAQLLSWERSILSQDVMGFSGVHMQEVRPKLWLGSLNAAADWSRLQECGVTKVLTCGQGLDVTLPDGVERLDILAVDDVDQADVLEHLPRTSDVIASTLAADRGGILVHCAQGKSRSASVVTAYLMREERLPYDDALAVVRSARPEVEPNPGFARQLRWYGRNGCPAFLTDIDTGKSYRDLPEFARLLRKYTAADIIAMCGNVGTGDGSRDSKALQQALDDLDRMQNAQPMDESARDEKKRQCRRLNMALDEL